MIVKNNILQGETAIFLKKDVHICRLTLGLFNNFFFKEVHIIIQIISEIVSKNIEN